MEKHAGAKATFALLWGLMVLAAGIVALVLEVRLLEWAWRWGEWGGLFLAMGAQVLILLWIVAWASFKFGPEPPRGGGGGRPGHHGRIGGSGASGYVARRALFSSFGRGKR